jgi:hypothetical protein
MSHLPHLTAKQRQTLETLADGRALSFPAPANVRAVDRQAATVLVEHGLATAGLSAPGRSWFDITQLGRLWLNTEGGRVVVGIARPGRGAQAFQGRRRR